MDLITGKAKEAFLKHENQPEAWLKIMQMSKSDTVLHALIIDWLDSVQIYITITSGNLYGKRPFFWSIEEKDIGLISYGSPHNDRHQATQEAIKKAVYLYNEKH